MSNPHSPFHPIIYVRGYAMTRREIDETTADPFCGFNLGSTVYRAVPDKTKPPRKFIFESPVLRLASDFEYRDVYEDGYDVMDENWAADPENVLGPRSIVVYRYYDEASSLLGRSETPSIETFAANLGVLILRVRDLVCGHAAAVADAAAKGRTINALYQIEALASTRGKLWFLTRRVAEEDSVACLTYDEWKKAPKKQGAQYLSTVFLANRARVNKRRRSLAYSLQLGVRVPDYEIDSTLWFDTHYEGGYLFRDALIVELTPPRTEGAAWKVQYAWQGQGFAAADTEITAREIANDKAEVKIPLDSGTTPGIRGQVRFVISAWNVDE